MNVLAPGAIIGILGGGQLGRMLSLAAARLGFTCHIYCPDADGPAANVSAYQTVGDYLDLEKIKLFAQSCDVVTYEFENVPAQTAAACAQFAPLRPGARALEVAQDRLTEKTFLQDKAAINVVPFADIANVYDLDRACKRLGFPAILKTRRLGYDGKGQVKIGSDSEIKQAYEALAGAPAILEQFAPFRREVSIVAARNEQGEFAAYPLIENVHRNHILYSSTCPAPDNNAPDNTSSNQPSHIASEMTRAIMDALDYVGVMATEFFEMDDGRLIVNEIAPRVHNSGHFSQNAGCCDQFELHIRAIAGWPLGDTQPRHVSVMTNLIGAEAADWQQLASHKNAHLHLYGKDGARAGRKMGHINVVGAPLPKSGD